MPRADNPSHATASSRSRARRNPAPSRLPETGARAEAAGASATVPKPSLKVRSANGNGIASGNGQETVPGWAGQLRLPLSWSLQTLMLMLHAGEEFQRAQLDCLHMALKRHEHAHQRLLACEDTAEMASVHADLLRFDTANLTQLSQRCMDAGVHLNTDLARLVAQALDGSRHHLMRSTFEGFQSGLRTGFRPLDEIFSAPILRELVTPRASASASPEAH
jgi:hypothetical protein